MNYNEKVLNRDIISKLFCNKFWNKAPKVFRHAVSQNVIESINVAKFHKWAITPSNCRLYCLNGSESKTIEIVVEETSEIYEYLKLRGEPITLLLNNVEKTSDIARKIRDSICIDQSWRFDDIVCTLSSENSGIGFHAGHEDGFIVQLFGERIWKVWHDSILTPEYNYYLLGKRNSFKIPEMIKRKHSEPILECLLKPGDILYIPRLFPHEGVTVKESISLSVAWAGISNYNLLKKADIDFTIKHIDQIISNPEIFYSVIDFPISPSGNQVEKIKIEISKALNLLTKNIPPQIHTFLHELDSNVINRNL